MTLPAAGADTALCPRVLKPCLPRLALRVETLVLACVSFLLLTGNSPFWRAALADRNWELAASWVFALALFVAFAAFYFAFTALLATRLTVRPLLSALLLCTALASWYMDHYAIYLDRAMLRNLLATDVQEAGELLVWAMVPHLLLFGVLPAALVWWPRLKQRSLGRTLAIRLGWVAAALVIGALSLLLVFADFASLMRNQRELRYLLTPGNLVAGLAGHALAGVQQPAHARLAVGEDAHLGRAWQARNRPVMFVLVVGETARSQNFSLNGYGRLTNPLLAQRDVISYPHATACGTSTEVSLPCMFSPYGRAHYDEAGIRTHESVLHVLARAGFKVLWRDNQSGCKGVCDGLPAEQLDHAKVEALCAEGQCLDEVLLQGMEGIARDNQGNLLVVMHQLGSHGPAYFKRYPALFRQFAPACENENLRGCTAAEIVNAYDNSLLYTDFFLSRVIGFLEHSQKQYDTAMLYVSDHGESLGEGGLYLHGMPYAIAPEVQTRVPLVIWLSPGFRNSFGINQECLRKNAGAALSHDKLFHSLLGVLDVQTRAYDRALDLFAPCRPPVLTASGPQNEH